MNSLGIPDWRDASSYGDTTKWRMGRWRWEFTRRRDDYRSDFEKALEEMGVEREWCGTQGGWDPEFAEELWLLPHIRSLPLRHDSARKYGLPELYDPAVGYWNGFGPEIQNGWGSGLIYGELDDANLPRPGAYSTLTFDLGKPLGPQLDEAGQYLEETAIIQHLDVSEDEVRMLPRKRFQKTKWLRYLRLLDAHADGASYSQMCAEILSDENTRADAQTARNMLNQARKQRDRF